MPQTLLEQLRSVTTIVADSGDADAILRFKPQDSTTNPSLIEAASRMPRYGALIDEVLRDAKTQGRAGMADKEVISVAFRRLAVAFGKEILKIIPGRVSTEVDARLSFDREATLAQARDIIQQYDAAGIARDRVLIKIASTWEGIQAARQLELENIHCNLTLLFGMHQAVACAEANVTLISPFVGRILDWHKRSTGRDYQGPEDPGVQFVRSVYNYLKKFGYRTLVMGASFRNVQEIRELAGCDLLTISPKLLAQLDAETGELPRVLSAEDAMVSPATRMTMDHESFEAMHRSNRMAAEELTRGIDGFAQALADLEQLLAQRLTQLGQGPPQAQGLVEQASAI